MSGFEIFGLIGTIVAIIDTTIAAYDAIRDLDGLPEAFEEVNNRLPLVQEIFKEAREKTKNATSSSETAAMKKVLKSSEGKLQKLQKIFLKIAGTQESGADNFVVSVYQTLVNKFGKKSRVESLMQDILKDLATLTAYAVFEDATKKRAEELGNAAQMLESVPPSLEESDLDDNTGVRSQVAGRDINNVSDNATMTKNGDHASNYRAKIQYNGIRPPQQSHKSAESSSDVINHNVHYGEDGNVAAELRDLHTIELHATYSKLLNTKVPNTNEWLFHRKEFVEWEKGQFGTGKTFIALSVTRRIEDVERQSGMAPACIHVFLSDGSKRPTTKNLFASLLFQLLMKDEKRIADERLSEFYKRVKGSSEEVIAKEYLDMIICEVRRYSRVFLIVDALDELQGSSQYNPWDEFQKALNQFPKRVSLLITSRQKLGFMLSRRRERHIEIIAQAEDIGLYVEHRITTTPKMERLVQEAEITDSKFRQYIAATITQKAQGLFVCAEMHMNRLAEEDTIGHFKKALNELPDMTPTFEKALQRIEKKPLNQHKLAKQALCWMLFAVRPLTSREVCHAFAVASGTTRLDMELVPKESVLLEACAGIFVTDRERELLSPIHPTANEYLRAIQEEIPGQSSIAKKCLIYISYEEFETKDCSDDIIKLRMIKYPLLKYAASHWAEHYKKGGEPNCLKELAVNFLRNSGKVTSAFKIKNGPGQMTPSAISGLHAVVYFDLFKLASSVQHDINSRCSNDQTALHWAAVYGRTQFIDFLINAGAEKDIADRDGNTPLHLAVFNKHTAVVGNLMEKGAKPDIRNKQNWTPLRWALKYGLWKEVHLLVKHKSEVNTEDKEGWTAFRYAISNQYPPLKILRLMVQNGEDVNSKSQDGWTPLVHAASHGDVGLVKFLLASNAQVDQCNGEGISALGSAATYGHRAVAKILLDGKADVNVVSADGQTPLMRAVLNGDRKLTWLLLDHGADLMVTDSKGKTALHYAVQTGNKRIVWLLLEMMQSFDTKDEDGRTALHFAVESANHSLTWLLLEYMPQVDYRDNDGMTALQIASRTGDERIAEQLLSKGARPNLQDQEGKTALHHATISGRPGIVELLVRAHADINLQDSRGLTAQHYISRSS
ncbi:ankyrin repeat protein [Colletotrichum asianum]|uniref:Ankyrin repeat protein n=1 Tax=Colletotrichum asianum TaxID=702518 RepID=A0A8H3VWF2_9PEZI|nr:ankyrin repeat protein [Colletotrichum asianum]